MIFYYLCFCYIYVIIFSDNAESRQGSFPRTVTSFTFRNTPLSDRSSNEKVPSMKTITNRHLYEYPKYRAFSQFLYTNLTVTPTKVKAGDNVTLNFNITNTGQRDGDEVYEVYISWLNATVPTPRYQLVNFNRTLVRHGQTTHNTCNITSQQMAVWIDGKGFVIEPGEIMVYVGGQLPSQVTSVVSNVLTAIFTIFTGPVTGVHYRLH